MSAALQGKRALVTGGGRGIGAAVAIGLAKAGARVAITARSLDQLEKVAGEIRTAGGEAVPIVCDVADLDAVENMVNDAAGQLKGLDLLVNNAGGAFVRAPIAKSLPNDWRRAIDVNLLGTYACCRAAVPHMIAAGGGKIINVGSGMGHVPRGGNSAYNVAKAGVWMLTRCLALEHWADGIEVNEFVPGPVYTELTSDFFDPTGKVPPPIADSERVKTPEECVPTVLFMATQPPGGPTGQSFSLARRPI